MDLPGMSKYIDDWLGKNGERDNSKSLRIQKITDEYLQMEIVGNILQLTIPPNFYTSCSTYGIINNLKCPFVGTFTEGKLDTGPELMTALNEKLERLSSRGYYSFDSVLKSIIDTFEKCKYCSDCDGAIDEEDEDTCSSDGEGYTMALDTPLTQFAHSESSLKIGYFDQLIDHANNRCDGARSVAISARSEVPCNANIKDDILRRCKVYSPSHSDCCVGFEIELSGILSDSYRHHHRHVFEALGFSFATPLLIEVMFNPLGSSSTITGLEDRGESIAGAFRGLSAIHGHRERKFVDGEGDDDPTAHIYADEQIAKVIDVSKPNKIHLYGLRSLLPRMGRDFFSQVRKELLADNNTVVAGEENIFVRFLLFIGSRLGSLLKRCIVCSQELPFTLARPSSCANELCLFGFEVLGLGVQLLQEIIRMPLELVDLEISLALAAADSVRDVFEPFPPFLLEKREIRHRSRLINNADNENPRPKPYSRRLSVSWGMPQNKNKNMDILRSTINSFPPVSQMRQCTDEVNLKAWLCTSEGQSAEKSGERYFGKKLWQLPYNVLRFILCTNRLSLVFLSENDDKLLKVDDLHSQFYQFAVARDSPEREAVHLEFAKNNQVVSRFGFHGSCKENWYSILRNGLRCLSNTKLMSAGNCLGDGIYLANNFEYSAKYAGKSVEYSDTWANGTYINGFHVVGICEVIYCPTIREKSGIFVVPKEYEESVALRYLLVYAGHHKNIKARISACNILSHGGHSVDLRSHYQNIRRKYASDSCSS